ncbi:hypothetical protein, conserved [Entamoeba dispar SAW760]|uniref:Uncharacterized protein n=1 Tax=Entamoeba dispar (strain ATCC PRA-260 / SAW760) TaxID=370354 RepID=B0ED35_ENTDS|nr:uncharacterized protein EDI_092430 [Entamoeba dispar SAW760]EDR27452.1 hypothetical protein, conserved [Entamoeba dispar SAW760]|eukprot:EDR27452.1 hypothetical protein, conserved [Entamoeba dispar SAW760]
MSSNNKDKTIKYKVITVGNYGIGKTTFVKKYCHAEDMKESFDSLVKHITLKDKQYDIVLCDTQDMEDISYITAFYYNDSQGVLLMVDLSNENGLKDIQNWVEQINLYEPKDDIKKPIKILVGTKADLEQKISDETIQAKAKELNMEYFKISSQTGVGVEEVMDKLFSCMTQKFSPIPEKSKNGCCTVM